MRDYEHSAYLEQIKGHVLNCENTISEAITLYLQHPAYLQGPIPSISGNPLAEEARRQFYLALSGLSQWRARDVPPVEKQQDTDIASDHSKCQMKMLSCH